jgi:protein-disulfide isomerase
MRLRPVFTLRPVITLRNVAIAVLAVAVLGVGFRYWGIHHTVQLMQNDTMGAFVGPEKAKNVVVEFTDYRCHACRNMQPVLTEFAKEHPDTKIVYRHYPIYAEPSVKEAEMALAASLQGKFLPMHAYLMSREEPVQDAEIPIIIKQFGLDADKFKADMKSRPVTSHLLDTLDATQILNIDRAPSFLFNGTVYIPPGEMPDLKQLDALYKPYHKE